MVKVASSSPHLNSEPLNLILIWFLKRFKTLRSEAEEKKMIFERLKALVDSHSSMVGITADSWRSIVKSWKKVS